MEGMTHNQTNKNCLLFSTKFNIQGVTLKIVKKFQTSNRLALPTPVIPTTKNLGKTGHAQACIKDNFTFFYIHYFLFESIL
jgi:hypothetical protein